MVKELFVKSLHDGQAYRGLLFTDCGMVKELFVKYFPEKKATDNFSRCTSP